MINIEDLRIGQAAYLIYDDNRFHPMFLEGKIVDISNHRSKSIYVEGNNIHVELIIGDKDILYESKFGYNCGFLNKDKAIKYYNKLLLDRIDELTKLIIETEEGDEQ